MRYITLPVLLFFSLHAFTQDCSKELLAKKTGTWKAGQQGSIHNVSAADLVKERSVLNAIHKLVSTQYAPTGCQVSYSTVFGKDPGPGQTWIGDPYSYTLYILPFLCDTKSADRSKYKVAVASATNVTITVNEIGSLNVLYAANMPDDDPRGYLKLKQKPQKKEGVWYMGEEIVGDYGTSSEIKEYRWLITYDDMLPFYYVSRKEYLLVQKKRLEKSLTDNPGEKDYTNKFLKNVNEYLKRPESELGQTAVCMWNEEERFERFVAEGTPGSFIAIKPNLNYYNKKLPISSPQFFTVVYKVSKGDPVFEDNIAAIKKAVDLATLKNMLGK